MSIRAALHRRLTELGDELFLLEELERELARALAGAPSTLGLEPDHEPVARPRVLGTRQPSTRLWTFARSDRMVEVIGIVGIMAPVGLWALAGQTEIAIIQAQWSAAVGCLVGMVQMARG